ncbi:Transposase DDE domain-containing protein [Methylobacterium sp. 174MFSha1.1]|nr:Transposase DDE domain-containing protein [Methylobacterium sp. 174MFSha1.1]
MVAVSIELSASDHRDEIRAALGLRVETVFCRLKDFRRIATRDDKLARNFASALALAAIIAFW